MPLARRASIKVKRKNTSRTSRRNRRSSAPLLSALHPSIPWSGWRFRRVQRILTSRAFTLPKDYWVSRDSWLMSAALMS